MVLTTKGIFSSDKSDDEVPFEILSEMNEGGDKLQMNESDLDLERNGSNARKKKSLQLFSRGLAVARKFLTEEVRILVP